MQMDKSIFSNFFPFLSFLFVSLFSLLFCFCVFWILLICFLVFSFCFFLHFSRFFFKFKKIRISYGLVNIKLDEDWDVLLACKKEAHVYGPSLSKQDDWNARVGTVAGTAHTQEY